MALELPDRSGFAEGWHLELVLNSRRGVTRNGDDGVDTCRYLSDEGVDDRHDDAHPFTTDITGPCWMASHARAYADVVLRDIFLFGHARARSLTADIDRAETATTARTLLEHAMPQLPTTSRVPLSAWLNAPSKGVSID